MNERSSSDIEVPSLRERIRHATANAIMVAAEEIFADQGIHGARVGDIAARAGVAVGTLYNHFKDQDALLAGLLDARHAELLERIDHALDHGPAHDFPALLKGVLETFFDFYASHRKFFRILLQGELDLHAHAFPISGPKASGCMLQFFQRLEKLIKRGVRDKALRPESAEIYPSLLGGMLRGIAMRDKRLQNTGPVAGIDQLVTFFLRGAGA